MRGVAAYDAASTARKGHSTALGSGARSAVPTWIRAAGSSSMDRVPGHARNTVASRMATPVPTMRIGGALRRSPRPRWSAPARTSPAAIWWSDNTEKNTQSEIMRSGEASRAPAPWTMTATKNALASNPICNRQIL